MQRLRWLVRIIFAFLANARLFFSPNTPIYRGPLKGFCFPGLNCYSCPAATTACPIGALQNFLANIRPNWQVGRYQAGFYVIGSLMFFGSIAGRFICGWICPFGLVQGLLHRIPGPKFSLPKWSRILPFVVLFVFVFLLPLLIVDGAGYGITWFCKYICPAGTLEAGIPLVLMKPGLRHLVSWMFFNKVAILCLVLVASWLIPRPFCRLLCPLGAIYGIFNRFSLFELRFDKDKCVECGACAAICPTGIKFYNGEDSVNSAACIRCLKCVDVCPVDAIQFGMLKLSGSNDMSCPRAEQTIKKSL